MGEVLNILACPGGDPATTAAHRKGLKKIYLKQDKEQCKPKSQYYSKLHQYLKLRMNLNYFLCFDIYNSKENLTEPE